MLLVPRFIDSMPEAMGLLVHGSFRFFDWPSFVILGVIYTALVCSGELSKDGPLIFSKRNARSLPVIFGTHVVFLMILFGFFRLAFFIEPYLPNWLSDESIYGRGLAYSAFEMLFILATIGMHLIERRWLYVESETDETKLDNTPS